MHQLRLHCSMFWVEVRLREFNGRSVASADTADGPSLGLWHQSGRRAVDGPGAVRRGDRGAVRERRRRAGGTVPASRVMIRALGLVAIVALTACAAEVSPSATPPSPVTVVVDNGAFIPPGGATVEGKPSLTVPVGTTVTWTNEDTIDHTATEYLNGFPKPDALFDLQLAPGQDGSFTFTEAGTYEVGCVPHPAMQMLVIVE